jgi:Resolvase, N terminal domain
LNGENGRSPGPASPKGPESFRRRREIRRIGPNRSVSRSLRCPPDRGNSRTRANVALRFAECSESETAWWSAVTRWSVRREHGTSGAQTTAGDIEERLVDVVVVYKVDRLTRSLSDFARMVEIFDRHEVSFVAVTQQFNFTTSMSRLTLNMCCRLHNSSAR